MSRYIEPILIVLLIASPAVGAYIFSKARKAHAKKRAEYERRIRSRRRKLGKEREKHYKEYLKTLSGGPRKSGTHSGDTQGRFSTMTKEKRLSTPSRNVPASTLLKRPLPKSKSLGDTKTDDELRRELDNILNMGADAETVLLPKRQEKTVQRSSRGKKGKPAEKLPRGKQNIAGNKSDSAELSDDEKQKLLDLFDN